MQFDQTLLETYRTLLQTTNLRKAYQEWLRMFRYLRTALEQQLPEYRFQGSVSENGMDYAVFFLCRFAFEGKRAQDGSGVCSGTFSAGGVAFRREPGRSVPLGIPAGKLPAAHGVQQRPGAYRLSGAASGRS